MKKIVTINIIIILIFLLSSCSKVNQPDYDEDNFEAYQFTELQITNTTTINSLKDSSFIAAYYIYEDTTRLYILTNEYKEFLIYTSNLINDNLDTISEYFDDVNDITTISVSDEEEVFYLSNNEKTLGIELYSSEYYLSTDEVINNRIYLEEFSGINLANIFVPILNELSNDDVYLKKFLTILISTDSLDSETAFKYIDFGNGSMTEYFTTGGVNNSSHDQSDQTIYIDSTGQFNIVDTNNTTLYIVRSSK